MGGSIMQFWQAKFSENYARSDEKEGSVSLLFKNNAKHHGLE